MEINRLFLFVYSALPEYKNLPMMHGLLQLFDKFKDIIC